MTICPRPAHAALALLAALAFGGCLARRGGQEQDAASPDPLRRTALVEVFERCRDSVVKFTAKRTEVVKPKEGEAGKPKRVTRTQWGSGCVLHEDGYILSNAHMLRFEGARTARFHNGKSYPVRLIAADEAHDLALLKLDPEHPLTPVRLGRSADVMVGEPAITIGSPFGIAFTMAAGIVSGVGRHTNTEYTHLTDMIQTDASISPGTSGGPLLNVHGEMIGLCTSRKSEGENIGFAIAIDQIRKVLPGVLAVEQRYGFVLGLTAAADGPAEVTEVAKGSPAEASGILVGDVVTRIGDRPVRGALDFHLSLIERKGGEPLALTLRRGDGTLTKSVTLGTVALRPADDVSALVSGLDYQHYHGHWHKLPDFDKLTPVKTGTAKAFELGEFKGKERIGLRFTGYVDLPKDGVYLFYTRSDDGSRLWIGDRLVVDNDGLHAAVEKRGFIPLKAGKHPIAVAFFECTGDDELKISYEGPGLRKQEIPAAALYRPGP